MISRKLLVHYSPAIIAAVELARRLRAYAVTFSTKEYIPDPTDNMAASPVEAPMSITEPPVTPGVPGTKAPAARGKRKAREVGES